MQLLRTLPFRGNSDCNQCICSAHLLHFYQSLVWIDKTALSWCLAFEKFLVYFNSSTLLYWLHILSWLIQFLAALLDESNALASVVIFFKKLNCLFCSCLILFWHPTFCCASNGFKIKLVNRIIETIILSLLNEFQSGEKRTIRLLLSQKS